MTGRTQSDDFPTTPGAFRTVFRDLFPAADVFVTKLDPGGTTLAYSTFLGGITVDRGYSIAVDSSGNAYVTGITYSADYPTTPGAFQTVSRDLPLSGDAFMTRLDPVGAAILYSTYLGGSYWDQGSGIAVNSSGNVHVAGFTWSTDFPTTPGAYQTVGLSLSSGFVTKFSSGLRDACRCPPA